MLASPTDPQTLILASTMMLVKVVAFNFRQVFELSLLICLVFSTWDKAETLTRSYPWASCFKRLFIFAPETGITNSIFRSLREVLFEKWVFTQLSKSSSLKVSKICRLVLCAAGEPLKDSSGERNMECSPTGSGANTCPTTHSCESTSGSTTFGGVCCPRPQYVCKLPREQVGF